MDSNRDEYEKEDEGYVEETFVFIGLRVLGAIFAVFWLIFSFGAAIAQFTENGWKMSLIWVATASTFIVAGAYVGKRFPWHRDYSWGLTVLGLAPAAWQILFGLTVVATHEPQAQPSAISTAETARGSYQDITVSMFPFVTLYTGLSLLMFAVVFVGVFMGRDLSRSRIWFGLWIYAGLWLIFAGFFGGPIMAIITVLPLAALQFVFTKGIKAAQLPHGKNFEQ